MSIILDFLAENPDVLTTALGGIASSGAIAWKVFSALRKTATTEELEALRKEVQSMGQVLTLRDVATTDNIDDLRREVQAATTEAKAVNAEFHDVNAHLAKINSLLYILSEKAGVNLYTLGRIAGNGDDS